MSKMINVGGKEISEDTVIKALKEHCNFEVEKYADVKQYCKLNGVYDGGLSSEYSYIIEFEENDYLVVPMPCTNNTWVLNAYAWVDNFMHKFKDKYDLWIYQREALYKENSMAIWIKICKGKTSL